MTNKYTVDENFIIVNSLDDKRKTFIKIDEESEAYQAIKTETNDFTENMDFPKTAVEILQEQLQATQEAVDFLLMGGM